MARAMKDSGIEWIGEIPETWRVVRGKTVFRQRNEKGNDVCLQLLSPTQKYGVIPQAEYEQLSGMKAVKLDIAADYSQLKTIHEGDFCISLRSFQGGFEYSQHEGVVSPAYQVFYPHIDCNDGYFKYLFKDRTFIDKMNSYTLSLRDGKNIAFSDFANTYIPFPPIDEQIRIAAFLDTECARIDAVIEQTRASIEEYRKLKQSVITQAVTKGIRPGRKMKDSRVEWIGEIPEDWKLLSLGAVTESMRNGYVGPTKDLFIDEGVKYIQSLHIKDGGIDFSRQQYYVSEEWANVHPKIKENDVLIVQTGDIGNVGLVTAEYDGCNCHALIIATPRTDLIFPQYLTFFLRSTVGKELLLVYKTGALLPHLNSGKIKFASICVPSLQEQKEIVNYLNVKSIAIDNLILKKELLASELESYKKSLIFEYVTGKKVVVQ